MTLSVCVYFVCVHSEVSCKTLEGVDGLKKLIYQVASSMKENSRTVFGNKLLGRLVSKGKLLLSMQKKIKARKSVPGML